MKSKTINAILCKKFDQFIASIEDEAVRKLVAEGSIITGGSIVSLLTNNPVNDFDIYFRNKEVALAVAKYYVTQFQKCPPMAFKDVLGQKTVDMRVEEDPRVKIVIKSAGIAGAHGSNEYQYFEQGPREQAEQAQEKFLQGVVGVPQADEGSEVNEGLSGYQQNTAALDDEPADKLDPDKDKKDQKKFRPIFMTANAITLSDKVQLVIRFYGDPDEIHKNYDFSHCCNVWTSWDRKLVLNPIALECILAKELRYQGSLYPICSMIRMRKFIAHGWTINAGQCLKIAWQINKLDLTDIKVLEEQLVGVDAAYFGQLIEALKTVDLKAVDGTYVASIIDKIF